MKKTLTVKALYEYKTEDTSHLQFDIDEVIVVLKRLDSGWCYGQIGTRQGWFPCNFCSPVKMHVLNTFEEKVQIIPTDIDTLGQLTPKGIYYKDTLNETEDGIVYTWGGLSVYSIHTIRSLVRYLKSPDEDNVIQRDKVKSLTNKVLESIFVMLDTSGMLSPARVRKEIKGAYSDLVIGVGEVVVAVREYINVGRESLVLKMKGMQVGEITPRRPKVDVQSKVEQWERTKPSREALGLQITDHLFELMKRVRDFATVCGQFDLPIKQPETKNQMRWSLGEDIDSVSESIDKLGEDAERIVRLILYHCQTQIRGEDADRLESIVAIKTLLKQVGNLVAISDSMIGDSTNLNDEETIEYQVGRLSLMNGVTKVVQLCQHYYNALDQSSKRVSTISSGTNGSDRSRISFTSGKQDSDPLWLANELITSLRTVLKLCTELVYQLKYLVNEREIKLSQFMNSIVQNEERRSPNGEFADQRRGSDFSSASRISFVPTQSLSRPSTGSKLSP